jgi:hypothetical protein
LHRRLSICTISSARESRILADLNKRNSLFDGTVQRQQNVFFLLYLLSSYSSRSSPYSGTLILLKTEISISPPAPSATFASRTATCQEALRSVVYDALAPEAPGFPLTLLSTCSGSIRTFLHQERMATHQLLYMAIRPPSPWVF